MKTPGWPNALSQHSDRFFRSAAGGVAVSFAVASPILLAASGLAIDYATHEMKVSELQAAADRSEERRVGKECRL